MKNYLSILAYYPVVILMIILLSGCTTNASPDNCWLRISPRSHTIQTTDSFVAQWTLEDVYLGTDSRSIFISANDDTVAIYGRLGMDHRCREESLFLLDVQDGKLIVGDILSLPNHSSVAEVHANKDYIYISYNGHGRPTTDSTWGAGGIAAYNLQNSQLVWSETIPGADIVTFTMVDDERVLITGNLSTSYYVLDALSGTLTTSFKRSALGTDVYPYAIWHTFYGRPYDISKNQEDLLYWSNIFRDVYQTPLRSQDERRLVLREGRGSSTGLIQVIDSNSGKVYWQTVNHVASNVALDGNTLFYLTDTAELVAADVSTGQIVGSVQFAPQTITQYENHGFYVTSSAGRVFVYFGDSRQLYAFQFSSQADH